MTVKVQSYLDINSAGSNYFLKPHESIRETKPVLLFTSMLSSLCWMCILSSSEIELKVKQTISITGHMEDRLELWPLLAYVGELGSVNPPKFSSAGDWLNKVWYIYRVNSIQLTKNRNENCYLLAWRNIHSILLCEKYMLQMEMMYYKRLIALISRKKGYF